MGSNFLPTATQNNQDGDLMVWSASNKSWTNSSIIPPSIEACITNTFYISQTGSDSNNGLTPATPFLTFAKALEKTTDRGHLKAIFAASTTPYNFDLSSLPEINTGFTLICQPETFGSNDVIYNQVYDTGVVNNVVLENHSYAPYTYCDYSGTTQTFDDLSASYIRFTSGVLNGQYFKAMAFQADGKLIIFGNASTAVNGDTFEVRRHSVVLNMTATYGGMCQHFIFNSLELNANGFSLLPFYCNILFYNAKLRLGGASFSPWSGGSIQFYESFMSINTPGTFNIANNSRTIIGSDVQSTSSILCGRSSNWGFISPDVLSDSTLEMTSTGIYWSEADITVGERLRVHRSLILSSLVQPGSGSVYIIRSFVHQPIFFPSHRASSFTSISGRLDEIVWRLERPTSTAINMINFISCGRVLMSGISTYRLSCVTNAGVALLSTMSNLQLSGTLTFTGICSAIFVVDQGELYNNATLNSSGMSCTRNIFMGPACKFINSSGNITNFQNGINQVIRVDYTGYNINYTSTIIANIITATSNNFKIEAGIVPLNNRGVQSFAVDTALTVAMNEVVALGGSTYTLPASTLPFNGKIWRIMNSSGGTLTIQVGAAEALKIRDNSGTLVNTVTMILGSSSSFIFLSGIYYQFN
jgi:hypothetical protein